MAAVAASAMSESSASNCWRFSFSDRRALLTDRRSFSLDRRPSAPECRVSYKSDDKLRRRNSWRWSWKNVFTRPFQSQSAASRAASFREKGKIRKKMSPGTSAHNSPKDSVEARTIQMAKLLRMWYADDDDSSDDSSDDEGDGRRSCSPRIIGYESSSSADDEGERMEQGGTSDGEHVSLYVSEGPSSSMDANGMATVQRVPEPGNQDGTNADATANSRQRSPETEEEAALHVNSDSEVLTEVDDEINHGRVISGIQICNLERYVDITNQAEHSCCSSCEQCNADNHIDVDKVRETVKSSEALDESAVEARCGAWTCSRGGGYFGESAAGGHRLSLPSPQEMSVEGSTDATSNLVRSDVLSAAIENKPSETRREELIKGSLDDEDRLEGVQCLAKQEDEQDEISDEMADLFSSQDLNAIRRFLGMSLQQISANKVLETSSVKPLQPAVVVSLGDLIERRNQQLTHINGHPPVMQTREVLPDYPSAYNKNGENKYTREQKDEPCELHCEFKGFGCPFQGTRWVLELEKHTKVNIDEHLTLVSQTAQEQKEQLKDQRLLQEKQGRLIRELTGTVHNLKDIVQDQMQKNQSQEKLILSLKDQLRDQRKQNQRFERETARQFQALDQSTPTTGLPSSPSAAEMLWPIKNFSKRLRRAREGEADDPLISEPFYTGSSGYKLSIWVYLNGRGKNLGSCVSVYARVMPGDNDTILNWPVKPVYTFTLFDQSEGEKDNIVRTRKVNDVKREGGKHHGIDRPGGGDRSVIVGFDDFIAHDQLERGNYLVDDCFFLKLDAKLFS